MPKYGVISGPYFPAFGLNTKYLSVFSPNTVKYGPAITPYLDTFHAVMGLVAYSQNSDSLKTENLFSNILLNSISELEKQLSQKNTLITFFIATTLSHKISR